MGGPYMYHQFLLYFSGLLVLVCTWYVPYMLDTWFLLAAICSGFCSGATEVCSCDTRVQWQLLDMTQGW